MQSPRFVCGTLTTGLENLGLQTPALKYLVRSRTPTLGQGVMV